MKLWQRMPHDSWPGVVECCAWLLAVGSLIVTSNALRSRRVSGLPASSIAIPIAPVRTRATIDTAVFDSAYALLARAREEDTPLIAAPVVVPSFTPPRIPELKPSLRGIIWLPSVAVLLEGAGLPEGGTIFGLNVQRGTLRLTAVRGDTAFVRGRDTSWVLLLGSRTP